MRVDSLSEDLKRRFLHAEQTALLLKLNKLKNILNLKKKKGHNMEVTEGMIAKKKRTAQRPSGEIKQHRYQRVDALPSDHQES